MKYEVYVSLILTLGLLGCNDTMQSEINEGHKTNLKEYQRHEVRIEDEKAFFVIDNTPVTGIVYSKYRGSSYRKNIYKTKTTFVNGIKNGLNTLYYSNGNIRWEQYFNDGIMIYEDVTKDKKHYNGWIEGGDNITRTYFEDGKVVDTKCFNHYYEVIECPKKKKGIRIPTDIIENSKQFDLNGQILD
jgi:antitoxin component YwqK of YwqJK toxin-antitoxin module